ncbi:MAG TPA: GNAT family N-acetyltransferase [Blastococcus sp.]|nr:GNAT family N-acetyltransferase [Blastococcus sp.]
MANDHAPESGEHSGAPEQYAIRSATIEDAPGIAEAHIASWQTAYRDLLPQSLLAGLSVERRTAQWQQHIGSGNVEVRVAATPAGQVGGFLATGRSRDDDATATIGELIAIYLRPQLWNRGIGGRLHATGLVSLATRFEQATLWVLEGNVRSRAFYERQGWRPDGTVKRDPIGNADVLEVRYRQALKGPHPRRVAPDGQGRPAKRRPLARRSESA